MQNSAAKIYVFSIEFTGGISREESATAESEKLAGKSIWNRLTNLERDNVESMECVEELPV